MKSSQPLVVFNRGRVSRYALARAMDVDRIALSAEVQTNWLPMVLGPMMLRPGTEYVGAYGGRLYLPFVFDSDDCAIVELGLGTIRVWNDGTELVTRPAVTATVTNDAFSPLGGGWTDADEEGAVSDLTGGYLSLRGTGLNAAIRRQQVTINEFSTLHALHIVVARGPVTLRVGTAAGTENLVGATTLAAGVHSIGFMPAGLSAWIEFSASSRYPALVDSCQIEAAGPMQLGTPWHSIDVLKALRWQQINDVIFTAAVTQPPRRIERRDNDSWSLVLHEPDDGPFEPENTDSVTLRPSGINGIITLDASRRMFTADHVGALFRLTSTKQVVTASLAGDGQFTDPIRVIGVSGGRVFTVEIAGTWTGTLTLQRSIGDDLTWGLVHEDEVYTSNVTRTVDDGERFDNVIAYYRVGFVSPDYGSGLASVTLTYSGGGIAGTVRVEEVTDQSTATAVVLKPLGSTEETDVWSEGAWSIKRGYPSAVAEYEGRMWYAGRGRAWGSVSDAFDSFDPGFEGDAGPIDRFIGDAGRVNWLLPLGRLIAGTSVAEYRIGSTTIDDVVTPTNYNAKAVSTLGSGRVGPVKADKRGYFVSGRRLIEVLYDLGQQDYTTADMMALCPEAAEAGIVRLAVQRQPETRIHCVMADGRVVILVRDPVEDVTALIDYETDGLVEDACVLPGEAEDRVFYLVNRNGTRHHERWARAAECRGGEISKCVDDGVAFDRASSATIAGLDHLEGRTVVVWADGADVGEHVVAGGQVVLPFAVTRGMAGLPYEARYRSVRLATETRLGTSLTKRQRINYIGLVLADTHWRGLEFGPDFETMDHLPFDSGLDQEFLLGSEGELLLTPDQNHILGEGETVWQGFGEQAIEFPGDWDTDCRVCLRAQAPRPCTVLAAVISIDTQDS